jgi:RNase H-fold protein (predicted Holliday junction resolvase)
MVIILVIKVSSMERELVLGIDYGGKYTGLAVVDRRNNQVLYARTIKMRDDVANILE